MTAACQHAFLAYHDDSALAGFGAPFLNEGLEQGDAVIAVYVPEKRALLADALGSASEGVMFDDSVEVYRRPETTISRYDATIRQLLGEGATSIRVMGELPAYETAQEWAGWIIYEALLNRVFERYPVRISCTWDERVAPEDVLETSRHAHPQLNNGGLHDNPDYHDPVEMVRSLTPTPQPLPGLREVPAGENARTFREQLSAEMAAAGVPPGDAERVLLAAAELYANAKRHGESDPTLRLGRAGGHFVCELADGGNGFDNPLAGYVPPEASAVDGAGLWVARQLASRLEFLPTPGGGMTARIWA